MSGTLFNYTPQQSENIRHKLHPDCCQVDPCAFCGASTERGTCAGDLSGLALELFEEASCSARNANVKSIGQFTNWQMHDGHARTFDAAARAIAKALPPASPANPGPSTVRPSVEEGL